VKSLGLPLGGVLSTLPTLPGSCYINDFNRAEWNPLSEPNREQ